MANRRRLVLVAAGAAVVVVGLVLGGVALGTSGVFTPGAGTELEAVVEEPRWNEPVPDVGPAPDSGQPTGTGICWVFSGGGWIGGPCPPGTDD